MSTTSAPAAPVSLISGLRDLAPAYDVVLCDVWGVVHNGKRHFAAACAALKRFREKGGAVVLVTNAPRPNPPVREQLDRLGVPRDCFDDIVTSGDVTLALIAAHGLAPLHHIGPERDTALFSILAKQTGLDPPRVSLTQAAYVVCTGLFDDQTETPADYDEQLALMASRGLELISANPDFVVHVGDKELYCSGAIADRYQKLGGRVLQAGKPFAPIYERAMEIAAKHRGGPVEKKQVLAIGDGLHTDIGGACGFGVDALFIAGGIHRGDVQGAAGLDGAMLEAFLENAKSRPKAALGGLVW
jgi:HAD superfamily hydrolase (TIGR01459 family)